MQRLRQIIFAIVLLVILIISTVFIVARVQARNRYGEAIVACPGPDSYGYQCERDNPSVAYIDATNDTRLYEDDGGIVVELPFPFTFYGQTYTEVELSSNGLMYFNGRTQDFSNGCPLEGILESKGDMIAPYWDDYTLVSAGFLETEVVGTAPNRIFVVEWDSIPRFAAPNDAVTFEIQLFEETNDFVFLYESVAVPSAANGRSATVAQQSERLGISLTAGCNQVVAQNNSNIYITHPPIPNPEIVGEEAIVFPEPVTRPPIKGEIVTLLEQLNREGSVALYRLEKQWQQQVNPQLTEWSWADVTHDGVADLVLIWRRPQEHNQIVVVSQLKDDYQLLWTHTLSHRPEPVVQWRLYSLLDKTGDGLADIILTTEDGQRAVWSWDGTTFKQRH